MALPKDEFKSSYYDREYFADATGKSFRRTDGSTEHWGYRNPSGAWEGCKPIAEAWKTIFDNPESLLDVGAGRGQFIVAAREVGVKAEGFDFSNYATGEGRYERCNAEWLKCLDATKLWPYLDRNFDVVIALDFFEHIYIENLDFVIDEMFRVARKWVFLQIAIVGGGSGYARHEESYILKKNQPIPVELEGNAVAGHVLVQPASFWLDRLDRENVIPRRDLVEWFYGLVPSAYVVNWKQNLVVILEKLE